MKKLLKKIHALIFLTWFTFWSVPFCVAGFHWMKYFFLTCSNEEKIRDVLADLEGVIPNIYLDPFYADEVTAQAKSIDEEFTLFGVHRAVAGLKLNFPVAQNGCKTEKQIGILWKDTPGMLLLAPSMIGAYIMIFSLLSFFFSGKVSFNVLFLEETWKKNE